MKSWRIFVPPFVTPLDWKGVSDEGGKDVKSWRIVVMGLIAAAALFFAGGAADAATPASKGCMGESVSAAAQGNQGAFGALVSSTAQLEGDPGIGDIVQAIQAGLIPDEVLSNTCN